MKVAVQQRKNEFETDLRDSLVRSRSGDAEAYRYFLEHAARAIRGLLRKSMKIEDRDIVEDLVQETLVAIHNKKHLYDEKQRVMPWIYAIARYRLIDFYRMRKSRPSFADVENFEEFISDESNPESELVSREGAAKGAADLLSGLSEQHKRAVYLAKVEEIPLAEIAKRLDLSLSAVKVVIHRAIKSLQKKGQRT